MEKKTNNRNVGIYVSTVLCTLACIVDTICGVLGGWPQFLYFVLWIQMGIVIYTVLDKRIPVRLQGILYGTFVCNSVFLSGLYVSNYYVEFILFCGTLILISLYYDKFLSMYQIILSMVALFAHHFVFHAIDIHSKEELAEYIMAVSLFVGVGLALYFNVRRENYIKEELMDTAFRAEKAEKAKSDFLANMSHEIRTPMNAIVGMCELALREPNLSMNVREYCSQIQNSGRSLVSIINDILDFSKIDSGKMELIEEEFNISSTLNDVVNMAMARMGNKKLEFVVLVDSDIPKGLLGDEIRIRQIMINILTNAIKYTNDGVVCLKVFQTKRDYGINLNVSVKDSGIGITKENMDKLFNAFQQVDTKKNRAVEGTGLGLVITKRLLTKMGGFVNVYSEYGKGSEFRFVIPLKVANPEPFISVKEPEKINAVCYLNGDKFENPATRMAYRKSLLHMGESIPVKHRMCVTIEDFKEAVKKENPSHCFVGKEEYLENQEYFDTLAEDRQVVLVQNRSESITVPSNMRCIYKPIYELPLASIFNNESSLADLMDKKTDVTSFVAPKAKILIVDDNAINLQVAVGLMHPYMMQISTASSGKEAIKLLESKDYDLLFMDHMMPEMDGVEATAIIRSKPGEYYKNLPIIALTANAVNGAREMFLANGFNGFVTKPIEISALDRALKQNLPQNKIESVSRLGQLKEQEEKEQKRTEISLGQVSRELVDPDLGLSYIGDDSNAYLAILKTYVEKGKDKPAEISGLYDKEDWKNYVVEVHALKSSSLSIGAKALSEKARALEEKGNVLDLSFIRDHHEETMELYRKVLVAGKEILQANGIEEEKQEETVERSIEREELLDLLEKIRTAIEDYDTDQVEDLAKEGLGIRYQDILLSDLFRSIVEAASDIDYISASEYLEEIAGQCGLEV